MDQEAEPPPLESLDGVGQGEREAFYRNLQSEDFAKSVPLFGSDVRLSVGGYVKFDLIGDLSGTGDRSQFLVSTIPVPGDGQPDQGSYVNLQAKETRIGFDMRHQTPGFPFNQAYIEVDFFGNDATYGSVRLRHAYLRWGNLLAGRTWTILSDLRPLPFLIDFAFGDALYGGRTGQVKWEQPLGGGFKLTAGLELADDQGIENVDDQPGIARANLPALAVRGDYDWRGGSLSFGSTVGQLRWDGQGAVSDATALQWSTTLGLRLYLDQEQGTYFGTQLAYGEGGGGGVAALGGQGAGAVLNAQGELEVMPVFVTSFALHYKWSQPLSSNLAWAWTGIDPAPDRDPLSMKAGGASHINLIWQVAKPFRVGAEFMYGTRVNTDGVSGNAQRVQFMAMYNF